MKKEAQYYEQCGNRDLRCILCPHQCVIKPGRSGFCKVRVNEGGRLYATTYARVSAVAMDPIEKKPLYHFYPGSTILSLGQAGCTFHCDFCQNYHLLTNDIPMSELSADAAVKLAQNEHSEAIAYTYNEPWVSYEYVLDTSAAARGEGLRNVMVTNGYYMKEPFRKLIPYIDAMNIDLKSIRDDFYSTLAHGHVGPVKRTIKMALDAGIHVELTTLLIPGANDSESDICDLTDYVASLDENTPLHLSAYRPAYKMNKPPTTAETMQKAYQTASQKLNYVYIGNAAIENGTDTRCPDCSTLLIKRSAYATEIHALENGHCTGCRNEINVIM